MTTPPPWLTAGRDFYKAAFEKRTRPGLDAAIDDWMHLSPEEHAFINSHLLYLNLLAQADQIALLEDVRAQLADGQVAQEELVVALLGARNDEDEPPGEDFGEDDGFYDELPEEEPDFEEEPEEAPESLVVLDVPAEVTDSRVVEP
jgi:hypothetical protein